MANVTQVKLAPVDYSGDQATVKVEYDIEFTPDEIGQSWRLSAEICGYDGSSTPMYTAPALYRFTWGYFKLPYKTVVPDGPVLSQTVSRTLQRDKLDEDPGYDEGPRPDINTPGIPIPHKDELFARVTITRSDAGVSPTVQTTA